MADVSKIFKPRRGKKSTMNGAKASTILAAGELFVEVPDTGVGKGAGKLKMGDGTTAYGSLPYLLGDTSNDQINFTSNSDTAVTTALNKVSNGAKLGVIVAALKQAISLNATAITKLNDDLSNKAAGNHNHDERYYTENEVNTLLGGKAASNHTHSGYAASNHTHDYSSIFAAKNHTHNYAASNHTHDYSGVFAAKDHSHNYAASTHGHAYSDISGRPTFSLSGTTLTISF